MEYSRVGVPLKTGGSFVSPSYSQAGRREEEEGGDMSNKVFLLLSSPHMNFEYGFFCAHRFNNLFAMFCLRKV